MAGRRKGPQKKGKFACFPERILSHRLIPAYLCLIALASIVCNRADYRESTGESKVTVLYNYDERIRGLSNHIRPHPVWFLEYLWIEEED